MVFYSLGEQEVRHVNAFGGASQNIEAFIRNRSVNRRTLVLLELSPFGEQLIECFSLEAVAAEYMIT